MREDVESCFIVPIMPGKTGKALEFWKTMSTDKAREVDDYARGVGQTMVMTFLQHLPDGDFLAQYIRSDAGIATAFRRNRELETPIAKYIRDSFADFAGYDFTLPENAPKIDEVYKWGPREEEGGLSRRRYVFALPLLPGKVEAFRSYFEGRKAQREEAEKNYRNQGILRLDILVQELPGKTYSVVLLESNDDLEEILQKIPDGIRDFWIDVSDIDLSKPENVPDIELLFEWRALQGVRTAEAQKAYTA